MVYQKLRIVGNSYVVTIPRDEIERLHLEEGQLVAVQVQPAEILPIMSGAVREAFDETWEHNEPGYRYLTGR